MLIARKLNIIDILKSETHIMVKSERINALRKQYDNFLEDDKKRRERNQFILDRMDKMRYCTATVPYGKAFVSNSRLQPQVSKIQDIEMRPTKELHTFIKNPSSGIDHTTIQEICKQFILIPKVSSNIQTVKLSDFTETQKSIINDNSDWRMKYDILNQLKNIDNEIISDQPATKYDLSKVDEAVLLTENKMDLTKTVTESSRLDFPEKDVSNVEINKNINKNKKPFEAANNGEHYLFTKETPVNIEINNYSEYTEEISTNNTTVDDLNCGTQYMTNNEFMNSQETKENNNHVDSKTFNTENQCLKNKSNAVTIAPLLDDNIYIKQEKTADHEDTKTSLSSEIEYHPNLATGDASSLNLDGEAAVFIKSETLGDSQNSPNENADSPHIQSEMITSINHTENIEVTPGADEINKDYDTIHNENDEQELQVNNDKFESTHVDDAAGIEAFNAEQNEMFYSEQTDQNYNYDQNYQGVEGEQYNQQYEQNQVYDQNEQFAYYEGEGQQQQVYQSDINEHEETMQHYDQNYQEQYAAFNQGDYNQQSEYQQLPEQNQYDEQEHVMQQDPQISQVMTEEYEQQPYENQNYESQEVIEQKIDNEQEFNEKQYVEDIEEVKPAVEEEQADENKSTQQVM